MDRIRAMRVMVRVARLGTLTAVSEELGMARGGASAIVTELERHLGVQLLERTTRRLRLTEDGRAYVQAAERILAEIEALEDEIGGAERLPRGRLRVQIPAGLARLVVAPALPGFCAAHPGIRLEILSRNGLPDFVGQDIDGAVVVGPLPDLDLAARGIGRLPFLTAAAPAYLDRRGTPASPDDLAGHDCIPILSTVTGQPISWRFRTAGGDDLDCRPAGPIAVESAEAAVAVAVRGGGILQLASYLLYEAVRDGRLVPVLDDARPQPAEMRLVHPRHRLKPRKLRAFEEFLICLNRDFRRRWNIRDG